MTMGTDYAYTRNVPISTGGCALLIVDPQVDFHPGGSLGIPSANEDASRIAGFIRANLNEIQEIYVTLDTHSLYHIAHPLFWVNTNGDHPDPFTVIKLAQVQAGEWKTSRSEHFDWAQEYLSGLEKQKRFVLTIWPPHCLVGTAGHSVVPTVADALMEWEHAKLKSVNYVYKGHNSFTEHYSGLKAEVEIEEDPKTKLNVSLINDLRCHSPVVACGQAKSHCVNFTVRDLADNWDSDKLDDLVVLEDGCSSVVGFEKEGEAFIADMRKRGLTIATCDLKV